MHAHSGSETRRQKGEDPDGQLAGLAALLQSIESDPSLAIPRIVQHALAAVGGRFALYNRLDMDGRKIITHTGCRLPGGFRRSGRLGGRVCHEELVRAARPEAVIPDLETTGYGATDPDVRRHRLRAYIGVPVNLDGRTIGSLTVYDVRPRVFKDRHRHLLKIMAQWVARAAERQLIEKRMVRKRANDKLLSAVSAKAISTRNDTFLDFCLQTIGRSLKLDAACILWYDPRTRDFSPHFSSWTPGGIMQHVAAGAIHLNDFPIVREVLNKRQPIFSSDTNALSDAFTAAFLNQHNISSLLLMPICHQHNVYGLFTMQMRTGTRAWEEENMDTLMAIMAIIAQWKEGRSISRVLDETQALNDQMLQLSPTAIYRIDLRAQRFVKVNDYMCKATGYSEKELLSMKPEELLTPESRRKFHARIADILSGRPVSTNMDYEIRTKSGRIEWGRFHIRHLYDAGKIWGANVVAHFITAQKKIEKELETHRRHLEALVLERTQALSLINQKLREEVARGRQTADELSLKTGRLEELNTAMRVLLDKRNEDRLRTEENIRVNLVQLIEPYLERLGNSGLNLSQQQVLDVIRMNITEVVGSPMPELSAKYYIFSPTELQVANLIRKGRTTKEVAHLLNLSPRTVESYRNSIRRKLGLKKKKVNLKTYLSTRA
jgi:PAS domain S-box-containing protein